MAPQTHTIAAMKDGLAGAVLMLFFAYAFYAILPVYVDVPDFAEGDILTPGSWPKVILIMGFCYSALLFVSGFYRYGKAARTAQTLSNTEAYPSTLCPPKFCMAEMLRKLMDSDGRSIVLMAWLILYALVVEPLGILLTSAIFLPVTSILYGERQPVVIICFTAILLASIYAFFAHVAQVQILSGTLFMS